MQTQPGFELTKISKKENNANEDVLIPASEIEFTYARSGGKGGQNVNKRDTKAVARFNIRNSAVLSDGQKEQILKLLAHKINENGELIMTSQEERSQKHNTENVIRKINKLINKALEREAERIVTAPTQGSVERRIKLKEERGNLKKLREKIKSFDE